MSEPPLTITPMRARILHQIAAGRQVSIVMHGSEIGDARDPDMRSITGQVRRLYAAELVRPGDRVIRWAGTAMERPDPYWRRLELTTAGYAALGLTDEGAAS